MKTLLQITLIATLALMASPVFVNGQTSPPATAAANFSLVVENEDGKQTRLTMTEIGKLKRQTVKADDHGKTANFEGFVLADVLRLAGIEFGESLRGKRLATFLLVEAADSYQAVFALPELDAGFTDKIVLLADRRDGQPLSKAEGEFRIVVPDEKRQGRWVRQVIRLKILRAASSSK